MIFIILVLIIMFIGYKIWKQTENENNEVMDVVDHTTIKYFVADFKNMALDIDYDENGARQKYIGQYIEIETRAGNHVSVIESYDDLYKYKKYGNYQMKFIPQDGSYGDVILCIINDRVKKELDNMEYEREVEYIHQKGSPFSLYGQIIDYVASKGTSRKTVTLILSLHFLRKNRRQVYDI